MVRNGHSSSSAIQVPRITRTRLVGQILACSAPIVVIAAPAGTGKSMLLEELSGQVDLPLWRGREAPVGPALWDVPHMTRTGPLPEVATRLILAKRPETAVPGLARAEVYGRVARVDGGDLLFDAAELSEALGLSGAEAATLFQQTGGWACLLPAAMSGATCTAALSAFLRDDLLRPLATSRLVALDVALDGGPVAAADLLGVPFMEADPSPLPVPIAACAKPMRRAIHDLLQERGADPIEARAVGKARAAYGALPEAIASFQSIGAWQAALDALAQARGPFFIHKFGSDAFDRMITGFPPDLAAQNESLVLCRAIQAIKRGDPSLTERILADRYGPDAMQPLAVIGDPQRYSLEFRFFRLLFQTWQDFDLDRQQLVATFRLLAELPADDDLRRGSFYNAVLEFYLRDRRFAEADHTAVLAASHYGRADVPILSFYIDLHRAIIQMFMGDPGTARKRAAAAAAHLARVPFDSPGDVRLLSLLNACIAYEGGAAEPLNRFLSLELDDLAQGEIWPTLVELTLIYGSQAQGEHFSTMTARGFLDRWRVRNSRSAQFGRLIDIREIVVMQNGNRWQEASTRAAAIAGRITQDWVEGAGDRLLDLQDRDEVALALVWLRHMAQVTPARPGLAGAIRAMLVNPHLTGRQRIGAEIWLAHVLRRTRQAPEALILLRATLSAAAHLGCIATLGEERAFLDEVTATRAWRDKLDQSDAIRRILRQMQDAGPGRARRGLAHGLTRQETRILNALAEGSTNKTIANLTGLSVATVKFHLSNLYRKLGCASRRDALKAAQALRLVS